MTNTKVKQVYAAPFGPLPNSLYNNYRLLIHTKNSISDY